MRTTKPERRTLPHDLLAERSVLGGVLIANPIMDLLAELEPDHFYDPRNRHVFTAMRSLTARAAPMDVVTLEAELERMGKLESIGGVAYLGELALETPYALPANVVEYARTVRDTWRWRDLMDDCARVLEMGYAGDLTNVDPVSEAAEVSARAARHTPATYITIGDAITKEMRRVNDLVDRRAKGEKIFAGLPFGFRDVDYAIGGAPFGTLTLMLGLRGGAKTSSTQIMAQHAAGTMARAGKGEGVVVYAHNEDPDTFFAQRAIAGATAGQLATERIARLQFDATTLQLFNAHGERVRRSPEASLILMPIGGMDGVAVSRLLMRIHAEHRLRGFVVDYLQRMRSPRGISNKADAIGLNSQELGNVAAETGAAGIVNAQLDPAIEKRDWEDGGPIPRLGDTRWSKDPESDARVILAWFDRWKYGKVTSDRSMRLDPEPGHNEAPIRRDCLELHCLKWTMGDSSMMWLLRWIRESHLITDMPHADNGRLQQDLSRWSDDEEAWRLRMSEKGDSHP